MKQLATHAQSRPENSWPHEGWNEADARRLVRSLDDTHRARRTAMPAHVSAEETLLPAIQAGSGRHAVLARTVEEEVIPRLLLACRAEAPSPAYTGPASTGPAHAGPATPTQDQVEALVRLALERPQPDVTAHVESLRLAGMPVESLLLGLLAPAARRLGVMWEDDDCSFSDVTLGMLRLAHVLRLLGAVFCDDVQPCQAGPHALLVQMPGEQHGLGLAMVQQFFRRAGWNVQAAPAATSVDLVRLVGQTSVALLGISVGCDDAMDRLATDIRAWRTAARNPHLVVMVGGPPFLAHPQLAELVGADATATDGLQAVQQAHLLVSQAAARAATSRPGAPHSGAPYSGAHRQ